MYLFHNLIQDSDGGKIWLSWENYEFKAVQRKQLSIKVQFSLAQCEENEKNMEDEFKIRENTPCRPDVCVSFIGRGLLAISI